MTDVNEKILPISTSNLEAFLGVSRKDVACKVDLSIEWVVHCVSCYQMKEWNVDSSEEHL